MAILSHLNQRENRGVWFETRDLANVLHGTDWATQDEMKRTRQALGKLARDGHVEQRRVIFDEWRVKPP